MRQSQISDKSDIEETKSAPLYYPPAQRKVRKERSDFAAVGLAQITVGANSVRPCLEFAIISEL
ncbi:MAG: hypothetical protein KHZ92_09145 [Ruminococcus bicirculans]|nr:hypothetical protein [Ruminococcus bicirculans (ex Wegman et al. 2014)]